MGMGVGQNEEVVLPFSRILEVTAKYNLSVRQERVHQTLHSIYISTTLTRSTVSNEEYGKGNAHRRCTWRQVCQKLAYRRGSEVPASLWPRV